MLGYLIVAMLSLSLGLILGGVMSSAKVAELDEQLRLAQTEIDALRNRAAERALHEVRRARRYG